MNGPLRQFTSTTLRRGALLPALTMLASCSTDSSATRDAVRDSAGITIVETTAPAAEWRLSAEPVLQIGVVDGADAYQFSSIAFAAMLSDGVIVVVDRTSYQIRFFDQTGRHTASLGRHGAGPGEFRGFFDVVRAGDSLLVHDIGNRRLSLIGPDATVVEEQSVSDHPAFASFGFDHDLVGVAADGRMVLVLPPLVNPPRVVNTPVHSRDTVAIAVATRRGESFDSIARVPGDEYLFRDPASAGVRPPGPGSGSGWMRSGVSFGYSPHFVLTADGIVYANGEGPGFEVMRLSDADSGPRTIRIVRRTDTPPVRVTEMVDRYAEWIGELVRAQGEGDAHESMARARADLRLLPPDHVVPRIDQMLADSEGRIWQRDYTMPWEPDETPRTWTVYSAAGQAIARLVSPWNFRMTQITNDFVVGVTRGEADVPFVTVYRLVR